VSATCPAGHASATTDYCDQCGARIQAPPDPPAPVTSATSPATSASPVSAPCPQCGAQRAGQDRFCESCGFDFATAGDDDVPAGGWAATVGPDRDYFTRMAAEGLAFPDDEQARTIALDAPRLRIGRRRAGDDAPEIALGDPAVSRLHASLVRDQDGSWAVVDEGSSNGTTINGAADPIPAHVEVPLAEGDRVHVGAWTTITVGVRSRAA
jgi:FHA domain/Double zinc ribbon